MMNLRAALSEGGGRMWPPGLQLPITDLDHACVHMHDSIYVHTAHLLYLSTSA